MSMRRMLTVALVVMGGLTIAAPTHAEDVSAFPSKPLKLVVPASPGGSSDAVGRILADGMSKLLGQQVVVQNISSAASIVGTGYVAKSDPDGYTMLISSA